MKHRNPTSWTGRPERRPVHLSGVALAEGVEADVAVSDLSYDGCQIHWDERLKPGEQIELRIIGRGGSHAELRWAPKGRAGVRFTD
jgi:hypothetical protein